MGIERMSNIRNCSESITKYMCFPRLPLIDLASYMVEFDCFGMAFNDFGNDFDDRPRSVFFKILKVRWIFWSGIF